MQTNLAMFECLKLQAFIMHYELICIEVYVESPPTIFFISNLLLLNHNPLIGKLHNTISLRNQEYYKDINIALIIIKIHVIIYLLIK
jgi:hypothetical protein